MTKVLMILLALFGGLWTTMAVPMEGGTPLTGHPMWYSHMVQIRKGTEFKCLGVILSSIMVFTSNYCELPKDAFQGWTVEGFGQNPPAAVQVAYVYMGKHSNDFKQVTLMLPGLQLPLLQLPLDPAAPGMHPPNWNNDKNLDWMKTPLVVLAYDGKEFKAGAVMIMKEPEDDPTLNQTDCKMMYSKAVHKFPNMPKNITDNLLCGMKAESKMNYTLFNQSMYVEPGTPCDDSLGSPVMGVDMVMGIVVKAFCSPDLTVAFIQPNKEGLKPEVPDITNQPPTSYTGIYTGTVITITGLSPRTRKTIGPTPHSSSPKIINQLIFWTIAVVTGIVSAV